jgi:hypothetical protein
MHTPRFRSAALAAFVSLVVLAAPALHAAPDQPAVNVSVRAEGEALADGFEAAFAAMTNAPVFITYTREDKGFATLAGIRSVRAVGSVLIIRTDRGPTIALPARSIVAITDERPSTP